MRSVRKPPNQRDLISKKLGRTKRGMAQIKQPIEERVLFDYFSIGCCIVELILKKDADLFYREIIRFESNNDKSPNGLRDIFNIKNMGEQPKAL